MSKLEFRLELIDTPTGQMAVVTDADGTLRALDWRTHADRMEALLGRHYGKRVSLAETNAAPSPAATAVKRYFDGDLTALDGLDTETAGTAFQREVWAALRTIPLGETWSYGRLAEAIGRPKAVRAVGLANGANPIAIVVPCHRVIGANGTLTGYGGGLERKTWLLKHEGVALV